MINPFIYTANKIRIGAFRLIHISIDWNPDDKLSKISYYIEVVIWWKYDYSGTPNMSSVLKPD